MWTSDLADEITELFAEAQRPLLDKFIRWQVRYEERRLQLRRTGFNRKCPEHAFYAKQRARYTHWKPVILEPPADPSLVCSTCGYRAHTVNQLNGHKRVRHEKQAFIQLKVAV